MDARGSFRLPLRGHRRRVVAEDRLSGVVPLLETNAPAPSEVNRGDHLHDIFTEPSERLRTTRILVPDPMGRKGAVLADAVPLITTGRCRSQAVEASEVIALRVRRSYHRGRQGRLDGSPTRLGPLRPTPAPGSKTRRLGDIAVDPIFAWIARSKVGLAIGLGILFRLASYFPGRGFWMDEERLVANIRELNPAGFFGRSIIRNSPLLVSC